MTEVEFAPLLTRHNATMDGLKKRENETLQEFWNHANLGVTGRPLGMNPEEFHAKRSLLYSKWVAIKELQATELQSLIAACKI